MALEISYFTGADRYTRQCYGVLISSAAYTVTGSSASAGTVPPGAAIARVKAGEACRVSNNDVAASATNGIHLDAGEVVDIEIRPSINLRAITA